MDTATMDPADALAQEPAPEPQEPPDENPAVPEPDEPGEPQGGAEPGEDLYMEGDSTDLTTDVGGKKPTDSKLQIVGKSIEIEGQVKKGARIRAIVELEVGGVKHQDKRDGPTGQVVACTRTHYASIVGFARQD